MKEHLKSLSRSSSEIFFLRCPLAGLGIFAITLMNPRVPVAGAIAVASAYLFARALKAHDRFMESGFYTFNPLLVGFSAGYLFQITLVTVSWIAGLGILTYALTHVMSNAFSFHLKLPILSMPFAIVSTLLYLASPKISAPFVTHLYRQAGEVFYGWIPVPATGYLKTMGGILFMPEVAAGLAFALMILAISRIVFFLTLLGYFTGIWTAGLLAQAFDPVFLGLSQFNAILTAVAVGGIFFIPSPGSYLLAALSVMGLTLTMGAIQEFWPLNGMTFFSLPYNIICLSLVYVLGARNHFLVSRRVLATPEETLEHYLADRRGDGETARTLGLPFSGGWTVWQEFDGRWTHKGWMRYAYDFFLAGPDGKSFRGYGKQLTDYLAFGKPVFSPVAGRVVRAIQDLPDNPPGRTDREREWGNHVVIKDPRGFYVELSHFAQGSIQVEEGEWVEQGRLLGRCGNSGNSPQPHIHLQVQAGMAPGRETLPFLFAGYREGPKCFLNALPQVGQRIEPLPIDPAWEKRAGFIPGTIMSFKIFENGRESGMVHWRVEEMADGSLSIDSGCARLTVAKERTPNEHPRIEGGDPFLEILALVWADMELAQGGRKEWQRNISIGRLLPRCSKSLWLFLGSFWHELAHGRLEFLHSGKGQVEARACSRFWRIDRQIEFSLDQARGLNRLASGAATLVRTD